MILLISASKGNMGGNDGESLDKPEKLCYTANKHQARYL
jgi:hypothetical protein